MSPTRLDPRLTPARPDLAATRLRGRVEAPRFSDGRPARVIEALADLRGGPRADAGLLTQLLHGEHVTVYDESEGWAWVQAETDAYVGYLLAEALGCPDQVGHRVGVNSTIIYPTADMKRPRLGTLPLGALVAVAETVGDFARLRGGGFVWAAHVAAIDSAADFVDVAEGLVGTPYLWGGKSAAGIDCSGLVQLAAAAAGIVLPRDTDMQEAADCLIPVDGGAGRRRGDLVFWPGHVGIMSDAETLLHASGHHMLVVREDAAGAEARIAARGAAVTSVKRHRADVTEM